MSRSAALEPPVRFHLSWPWLVFSALVGGALGAITVMLDLLLRVTV